MSLGAAAGAPWSNPARAADDDVTEDPPALPAGLLLSSAGAGPSPCRREPVPKLGPTCVRLRHRKYQPDGAGPRRISASDHLPEPRRAPSGPPRTGRVTG